MINKRNFIRFVGASVILATALAACAPTPVIGGIVQGVVYGDLNSDGIIDDSEQTSRVPGAEVLLVDCGPDQTVLTDADGKFEFQNLPEGTCHVSVSKAGWIYDGMYPVIGVYPIPVASDASLPTAFSIYMAPVMDFIPTETPTTEPVATFTPSITVSADPMVTPLTEDVNCRFGPGVGYASTGALAFGATVPILGTIDGGGWWQIANPFDVTAKCWVGASVTSATGDLGTVPVLPIPTGLVTAASVSVSSGATLHGYCGGPNAVNFSVSITTNGPATVTYKVEIFNNGTGALLGSPGNTNLVFASASTQTFDPGGAFKTDCGTFLVRLTISSPNSLTTETTWSVVNP